MPAKVALHSVAAVYEEVVRAVIICASVVVIYPLLRFVIGEEEVGGEEVPVGAVARRASALVGRKDLAVPAEARRRWEGGEERLWRQCARRE
jgi:hypothetical protein